MKKQKMLLYRNDILLTALFIFSFATLAAAKLGFNASFLKHVPFLIIILCGLSKMLLSHDFRVSRYIFLYAVLCAIFSVPLFIHHSLYSSVFYIYLTGGALISYIFFRDALCHPCVVKFIFVFLIIQAVICIVFGIERIDGQTQSVIPFFDNKMMVNISGPGLTIHRTAAICGLGMVLSFYHLLHGHKQEYLWILLFGYFVFFSNSRIALLATLMACATILLLKYVKNEKIAVSAVIALLVLMIFLLVNIDKLGLLFYNVFHGSVIGDILNVQRVKMDVGFASGREWLWHYHWYLFSNDVMGVGLEKVRYLEVGDTTELGKAQAGTESFYTRYLAAYGIFAILILAVPFFFLAQFLGKRDVKRCAIVMYSGVFLVGAGYFNPPLNFGFILILALLGGSSSNGEGPQIRKS